MVFGVSEMVVGGPEDEPWEAQRSMDHSIGNRMKAPNRSPSALGVGTGCCGHQGSGADIQVQGRFPRSCLEAHGT